jgi:hypothetical protein
MLPIPGSRLLLPSAAPPRRQSHPHLSDERARHRPGWPHRRDGPAQHRPARQRPRRTVHRRTRPRALACHDRSPRHHEQGRNADEPAPHPAHELQDARLPPAPSGGRRAMGAKRTGKHDDRGLPRREPHVCFHLAAMGVPVQLGQEDARVQRQRAGRIAPRGVLQGSYVSLQSAVRHPESRAGCRRRHSSTGSAAPVS